MRYYFPGPLETVDPEFDFGADAFNPHRVRQQDDVYAHELLETAPYDGILIARSAVHPEQGGGRASFGMWQRLLREGGRHFMRLDRGQGPIRLMGDCGAYAYVSQARPSVSVPEILDFYERVGVDFGLSVDHIIPGYVSTAPRRKWTRVPRDWIARRELTVDLARDFLREHGAAGHRFTPLGVAQGWDPASYAESVHALQAMGYRYIAIGGLARLSVPYIANCLEVIDAVRDRETRLHLLGVFRPAHLDRFTRWGVASFDSSAPLRQAFLNEAHNYYAPGRTYRAVRIAQATGNRHLRTRISLGDIRARDAFERERSALQALRDFDAGRASVDDALACVRDYELLFTGKDQTDAYRETLEARPWERCSCAACTELGIDIVLLRGKQRNNRRGFHNLHVFYTELRRLTTMAVDDHG